MGQMYTKVGMSSDRAIIREFDEKIRHKPESLELLLEQTRFTKVELKYLYQSFKQTCPSGYVTKADFADIVKGFYCIRQDGDPKQYANFIFRSLDTDDNGIITFTEFACTLSMLTRGAMEDRLNWIFKLYDSKNRGYLIEEDFLDIYRSVISLLNARDRQITNQIRKRIRKNFMKFDTNHDGKIRCHEFINSCLNDDDVLHSLEMMKVAW